MVGPRRCVALRFVMSALCLIWICNRLETDRRRACKDSQVQLHARAQHLRIHHLEFINSKLEVCKLPKWQNTFSYDQDYEKRLLIEGTPDMYY